MTDTTAEYRAKRNEFNAMARRAKALGDHAVACRCWLFAKNYADMTSDDPVVRARGERTLALNQRRWRDYTTHWVRHPSEIEPLLGSER